MKLFTFFLGWFGNDDLSPLRSLEAESKHLDRLEDPVAIRQTCRATNEKLARHKTKI